MKSLKPTTWLLLAMPLLAVVALLLALRFFAGEHKRSTPDVKPRPAATSYRLRLGLNLAANSALHAAALKFAEQIKQKSQGRVQVLVFPDQQLGSDEQMLEMARNGKLDFLLTPTAKLSSDVPAMQYADLPFYFSDRAELYAMLDGEPGTLLLGKLKEVGLVGVTFWENGFKQFTANRPILSPQDFAGLRIRTMKSRLLMDQFKAMGAEAVVIDFATLRQALADGVVAGQENPIVAIAGKRLHEVQKHMTLSNHAWLGYVFSVSRKVFEHLPDDVRNLIVETARELSPWEREETARREQPFLAEIRAAGVEIHELDQAQRQKFATALAPLVRRYSFEIGYDLLAKTEELRLAARLAALKPGDKGPLLVGLDADLSSDGRTAGGAILRGVEMALAESDDHGGVRGRPLALVARDHMHNPERGNANLRAFAKLPDMLAVVGGKDGPVIEAEMQNIHDLQLPYLIPWAAVPELVSNQRDPNYCFRLSLNHDWVAPFMLRQALARGTRVAVLLERSAMGRSNADAMQALVKTLPPDQVRFEWFNQGDTEFQTRLAALQADGIDVLVMVANFYEASALIQADAQLAKPLPVIANWGLTGGDFWQANKAALTHVDLRFVQSILLEGAEATPAQAEFRRRYRAYYGLSPSEPIPAPIGTVQAYELTRLLVRAATRAASSDRRAIRDALEHEPAYAGIIKAYAPPFSPGQHEALDAGAIRLARYDSLGRIVAAR